MTILSTRLGPDGPTLPAVGIGTWQWGDRKWWGFDPARSPGEAREAYRAAVEAGVRLFDTAERYGGGTSEELLGRFAEGEREGRGRPRSEGRGADDVEAVGEGGEVDVDVLLATKYAPMFPRLRSRSLHRALDASLARLRVERVGLYQLHWPSRVLSNRRLLDRLADEVQAGRVQAVGVSNYGPELMRRAHACLARRGISLASNQVSYSLLHRQPEQDGTLAACRELGVTLIAYSPLGMGALTGRYRPGEVRRLRRLSPFFRALRQAEPLIAELRRIAQARGRSPAQVALNWLARQEGVLPIPGARNRAQALDSAGSVDFRLEEDEAERLERLSRPWRG